MENNKYYTPEINEICIGLEYEGTHNETEWRKHIFDLQSLRNYFTHIFKNNLSVKDTNIRVKYLDQADIESCGFIHKQNYYFENDDYELFLLPNNRVIIKEKLTESNMNKRLTDKHTVYYQLFDGEIKNKSILIQVLKMIGVE